MPLKNLKSDAISGFLVFLIALPLCLGIAKASGFPPIAGIYTAVVGGLLITFLSNAQLAIKGPAAGLIVIAIGAVDELGGGDHVLGYKLTLAVIVISGILQVFLGLIKSGKLGDFFPVSVIHGMLAAIGVIIISKQIHIVMGVAPTGKSPFALLAEIPKSILIMNPEVAIIGFISLAVLFIHPLLKIRLLKSFPAPLLVLVLAIPMSVLFDLSHAHDYELGSLNFHIDPKQLLVALPDSFFSGITFPDFSQLLSYTSIKYIIMFALVGSIESILSAKAIDTLDSKGRKTNMNRDLIAVGLGNTLTGFIGGLPMISEIVRSSANINNGGKTRMSNFFHALFLFLFVLLAGGLIKMIPNAALSAMLVYTGFKLASPKEFQKMKSIGYDQLLQFLTTLLVTLFTDLLLGVTAGILLKVMFELMQGARLKELFTLNMTVSKSEGGVLELKFLGVASFINYLKFKSYMDKQSRNQRIVLDFSETTFIDHTFLNNVHQMQNEFSKAGGLLSKIGFDNYHFQSDHHLATRRKIINPYKTNENEVLSSRQKALKEMSTKFNFEFEANASSSLIRPYLSPFTILSRFRRARSFLIGTRKDYNIMICDLSYESIDYISKNSSRATVAVVYNISRGGIPDFYTEDKSSLFNLSAPYGFDKLSLSNSIPFDVYGDDVQLSDKFFDENITKLIGKNQYTIECQRRVFLIHYHWNKIPEGAKMEKFVNFVDEFARSVMNNNQTS